MSQHVSPSSLSPKTATDADRRIGERIAVYRKLAGLSQTALGQAVGVTFQQMQKYETGTNRIGAGRLQAIAVALHQPVVAFFDEAGTESAENTASPLDMALARLSQPGATEMLDLYTRIPGADQRGSLVVIARALAGTAGGEPAPAAE